MINKLPYHASMVCLKFRNMKRSIIIIILATFIPLAGCARNSSSATENSNYGTAGIKKPGDAASIIRDFDSAEGFNVLSIKGFGTGIIKHMIIAAMDRNDPEQKAFADLVSGIKRLTVVEYSDCDDSTKERFLRKMDRVLNDDNLLMDVKDSGESLKIYGTVSEDGGKIQDFFVHAPNEGAFILLSGTLSMDSISGLMEQQ